MRQRHANEKYDAEQRGWIFDEDKARENFGRASIVDGVVRWKSSNNVPFDDMLQDFALLGLIDEETMARSVRARQADNAIFDAEYRRQRANYVPSDEEVFEMRAAFGEGATVVNVITGQKYNL
jgi:hypothetical protein